MMRSPVVLEGGTRCRDPIRPCETFAMMQVSINLTLEVCVTGRQRNCRLAPVTGGIRSINLQVMYHDLNQRRKGMIVASCSWTMIGRQGSGRYTFGGRKDLGEPLGRG